MSNMPAGGMTARNGPQRPVGEVERGAGSPGPGGRPGAQREPRQHRPGEEQDDEDRDERAEDLHDGVSRAGTARVPARRSFSSCGDLDVASA